MAPPRRSSLRYKLNGSKLVRKKNILDTKRRQFIKLYTPSHKNHMRLFTLGYDKQSAKKLGFIRLYMQELKIFAAIKKLGKMLRVRCEQSRRSLSK